jgi:hypothetical protein
MVGLGLRQFGLAEQDVALWNGALFEELTTPIVELPRLIERRLGAGGLSARPLDVRGHGSACHAPQIGNGIGHGRLRLGTLCQQVAIVELREHLARRHVVAFPNQQFPDRSRDPGADVGLFSSENESRPVYGYFDLGQFGFRDLHIHNKLGSSFFMRAAAQRGE